MKPFLFASIAALAGALSVAAADDTGFVTIFDGKSFDGWKIGDEAAKSWKIEDGALLRAMKKRLVFMGTSVSGVRRGAGAIWRR